MVKKDKLNDLFKSTDDFQNHDNLILRDRLALVRTRLANERTLFSYMRTSLYLLTVGVGILEIDGIKHLTVAAYIGLICSCILFILGWVRYFQMRRCLKSYLPGRTHRNGAE